MVFAIAPQLTPLPLTSTPTKRPLPGSLLTYPQEDSRLSGYPAGETITNADCLALPYDILVPAARSTG